jgi:hypothetical protein
MSDCQKMQSCGAQKFCSAVFSSNLTLLQSERLTSYVSVSAS